MVATPQQIKEQAQAIANQAQAIADGKIPEDGQHGHAALILQNAKTLYAWASKRRTPETPESAMHNWVPGDTTTAMQTDPLCRVCHEPKRSAVHS